MRRFIEVMTWCIWKQHHLSYSCLHLEEFFQWDSKTTPADCKYLMHLRKMADQLHKKIRFVSGKERPPFLWWRRLLQAGRVNLLSKRCWHLSKCVDVFLWLERWKEHSPIVCNHNVKIWHLNWNGTWLPVSDMSVYYVTKYTDQKRFRSGEEAIGQHFQASREP